LRLIAYTVTAQRKALRENVNHSAKGLGEAAAGEVDLQMLLDLGMELVMCMVRELWSSQAHSPARDGCPARPAGDGYSLESSAEVALA
jgi:hypothetical protein